MVKLKQKLKSINIRTWILAAVAAGILAGTLIFLLRESDGKSRGNDGGDFETLSKKESNYNAATVSIPEEESSDNNATVTLPVEENNDTGDFISLLLDQRYPGKAEEYLKYYEPYVETAGEIYKDGDVSISMQYAICDDMVFVKRIIESEKKIYTERGTNWGFRLDKDQLPIGGEKYEYWFNDGTGRNCTGRLRDIVVNKTKKGIEELTVLYLNPNYEGEVVYVMRPYSSITELPLKSGTDTRIRIKRDGGELIFTPHQLYWSGEIEKNFTEMEAVYKDGAKAILTRGDDCTGYGNIHEEWYWYKRSSERMSTENVEKIFLDGVEAGFEVKER